MNRLDLNELLKTIVCNAAKLMNTLHVYICLCDESKGTYTRIIGTGVYQKNQGEILPVTQGLTGHVYQVGRLTIIDDYSLWEKRLLDSEFDSMHCTLQVPFLSEAKVVGVLGVSFDDPKRKFTEEEVHLVTRFSELASIALDNATSFAMIKEEKMKLQALIDIIPDIMFRIKRDGTFIGCKADDKVLYIPSDQLLGKKVLEVLPLGIGKEIMLNIENALNHEQLQIFEYELPVQGELHYYEARIIKSGTDEVVAIIRNISERKQMEEKLEYLSLHDSMTGLYNRAYFEVEMERIQEGGNGQVGIIICDLDGLKVINDTLGHSVGDEILKAVAGVLKKAFHPSDLVARIGGDEFAVILPSNSVSIFTSACRRIREMTEEWNLKNPLVPISLSIGFAVGKEMPADVNALFKAADNYMYREKLHRHQSSKNAIVQALISALEARDFITEGHGDRLRDLVASLAIVAGLPESSIADLRLLAQFHDIGKVGIPDNILFKPGRLTKEEFDIMQGHCEIGYRIAKSTSDLEPIADWILKHHEWWDGTGYPFGIKGEAIPIECRILSIVDSYDAMTNDRPYREAMSKEKAMAELRKCAGSQFDPHLVGLFIEQIRQ